MSNSKECGFDAYVCTVGFISVRFPVFLFYFPCIPTPQDKWQSVLSAADIGKAPSGRLVQTLLSCQAPTGEPSQKARQETIGLRP